MHRTVQAANQTRMSAMRALAEERMRSLELENKISRQVRNKMGLAGPKCQYSEQEH